MQTVSCLSSLDSCSRLWNHSQHREKIVVHSVQTAATTTTSQASRRFSLRSSVHLSPKREQRKLKNGHIVLYPCILFAIVAATEPRFEIADTVGLRDAGRKREQRENPDPPAHIRYTCKFLHELGQYAVNNGQYNKFLEISATHLPNSLINHFPALCSKNGFIWGSKYCLFPNKMRSRLEAVAATLCAAENK